MCACRKPLVTADVNKRRRRQVCVASKEMSAESCRLRPKRRWTPFTLSVCVCLHMVSSLSKWRDFSLLLEVYVCHRWECRWCWKRKQRCAPEWASFHLPLAASFHFLPPLSTSRRFSWHKHKWAFCLASTHFKQKSCYYIMDQWWHQW